MPPRKGPLEQITRNSTRILLAILMLFFSACATGNGENSNQSSNTAPTADAGPNQSVKTGSLVTLDGSNSDDPDNDFLSYLWSFTSAPTGSSSAFKDPTAVRPTFNPDVDGTYFVGLVVNDGKLDSEPDTVRIEAATFNSPPVANAGTDQSVAMGDTVLLDGTGSNDGDNDTLTYFWSFISIPDGSTATLTDPTSSQPSFTADAEGIYQARLIVNDGAVSSEPDTVVIESTPPLVNIFLLPAGDNAILLLASKYGGVNEFVKMEIWDTNHAGSGGWGFLLDATISDSEQFTDVSGLITPVQITAWDSTTIQFTTTDEMGFGDDGITFTVFLSADGYTTINGEDFKISSAAFRFRDLKNGTFRVEMDLAGSINDVPVDSTGDFDDLLFIIGPRDLVLSN